MVQSRISMQIPILNGIYTNESSDFRTDYPRNLIPVPKSTGISGGYLRPADGIEKGGNTVGADRGGINWFDKCYRVSGDSLVEISHDGSLTVLGNVGGGNIPVSLDYSFDRLAIASNGSLFYWDGVDLTQVTDHDLGIVKDMIWVDGYFMTTDGEFLIVTDLDDPTSINPTKYGSSEVDGDPINGLLKIRNEVHVINRYTIEVFDNVGSEGFPFQRIKGAQITKGSLGTHCICRFLDAVAFLGGGKEDADSIWLGSGGNIQMIANREIMQILKEYSKEELSSSVMEAKIDNGHAHLLLHLHDQTLVYDANASKDVGKPVWFKLTSGIEEKGQYLAKYHVWCYNKWIVGDPVNSRFGYLNNKNGKQYGEGTTWSFSTQIIYNESNGALFHEIELVSLSGRTALGNNPTIGTQYSLDGETWSQWQFVGSGKRGERQKRLVWLGQGNMRNWRIQRFHGTDETRLSIARLEVRIEPLRN